MSAKKSPPRKPRADAQRNREHIVGIAKQAFASGGVAVSMDEIAKLAQIGPGTLYRHFPTRDALIEAVYRVEVEKLAAAERGFAASLPPVEALRAWLLLFVDYIATKKIIAPALNTLVGGPSKLYDESGALILGAIQALVNRAVAHGDLRPDLEPMDLLRALMGVASVLPGPDWERSAKLLIEILLSGARPSGATRMSAS